MQIRDLAQPHPVTVSKTTSVRDAATRMRRFHVGDVVVTETSGARERPVGILTDRDITIGLVGPASEQLPGLTVGDVLCEQSIVSIHEDAAVEEAVDLLHANGIRRLPVVDGHGQLMGIVTLDDLVRHYTAELTRLAEIMDLQRAQEVHARP